jgi:hypothetical protein
MSCSTTCPLPSNISGPAGCALLAVTAATRWQGLPDVPTLGDFVPGFETSACHDGARRALQGTEVAAGGVAVNGRVIRNWRGHDDVMQTRSFRGSGEPARVNASSNARVGLGPDPRRALGPAAIRAASKGRTHDRTRQCCINVKKLLSTRRRPHMTLSDKLSIEIPHRSISWPQAVFGKSS